MILRGVKCVASRVGRLAGLIWRAFPFCISALLLIAVIVPGCLKRHNVALDGGNTIKHDYESYWEPRYFPLLVHVDNTMPIETISSVNRAIDAWNYRAGATILVPISVDFDESLPSGCGWIAAVQKELDTSGLWRGIYKPGTSKMCHGEVSVRPEIRKSNMTKLWMHELGHALGLAHDHGDRRSIMYPVVYTDFPQYIMPDDAISVLQMSLGVFSPMEATTRAKLNRFLADL